MLVNSQLFDSLPFVFLQTINFLPTGKITKWNSFIEMVYCRGEIIEKYDDFLVIERMSY